MSSRKVFTLWSKSVRTELKFVPQRQSRKNEVADGKSPRRDPLCSRGVLWVMQSKTNKYMGCEKIAAESATALLKLLLPLLARGGVWLKAFISVCNIFIMRESVCRIQGMPTGKWKMAQETWFHAAKDDFAALKLFVLKYKTFDSYSKW